MAESPFVVRGAVLNTTWADTARDETWQDRALVAFRDSNPFTLTFDITDRRALRALLVAIGARPSMKGRSRGLSFPAWTLWHYTWEAAGQRCRTCGMRIARGWSAWDGAYGFTHWTAETFDIDHRARPDVRRPRKTHRVTWRRSRGR